MYNVSRRGPSSKCGKSQNFQVNFLGLKKNQEFKNLSRGVPKSQCVLNGSTLHGRKEKESPVSYIYTVKFQLLSTYLDVLR